MRRFDFLIHEAGVLELSANAGGLEGIAREIGRKQDAAVKFLEFRSNPNAGLLQLPTGGNGRPGVILAERSEYLLREFSGQGGLLPAEIKFKEPELILLAL